MMEIYWATLFHLRNDLRYLYIDPAVLHAPIYIIACNELLNRTDIPLKLNGMKLYIIHEETKDGSTSILNAMKINLEFTEGIAIRCTFREALHARV